MATTEYPETVRSNWETVGLYSAFPVRSEWDSRSNHISEFVASRRPHLEEDTASPAWCRRCYLAWYEAMGEDPNNSVNQFEMDEHGEEFEAFSRRWLSRDTVDHMYEVAHEIEMLPIIDYPGYSSPEWEASIGLAETTFRAELARCVNIVGWLKANGFRQ